MYFEFLKYDFSIRDEYLVNSLYGYTKEFVQVYQEGLATASVKEIYNYLLQGLV